MNPEGYCEKCNNWDMTQLSPRLRRCEECWELVDEGEECWCQSQKVLESMETKTETVQVRPGKCARCFRLSYQDECPNCSCRIMIPVSADPDDPLLWACMINRSAYKEPKSGDVECLGSEPVGD